MILPKSGFLPLVSPYNSSTYSSHLIITSPLSVKTFPYLSFIIVLLVASHFPVSFLIFTTINRDSDFSNFSISLHLSLSHSSFLSLHFCFILLSSSLYISSDLFFSTILSSIKSRISSVIQAFHPRLPSFGIIFFDAPTRASCSTLQTFLHHLFPHWWIKCYICWKPVQHSSIESLHPSLICPNLASPF